MSLMAANVVPDLFPGGSYQSLKPQDSWGQES